MAAVEITITGVLYDKVNRTTQQVVLIGESFLTHVGIGGGPIIPDPKPPRPPVGIWPNPPEGTAPIPGHPIALPGDPWWGDPHPTHPIVIPPPPTDPPPSGGGDSPVLKPPPDQGGWGYVEPYGWAFFPMGGVGPKRG